MNEPVFKYVIVPILLLIVAKFSLPLAIVGAIVCLIYASKKNNKRLTSTDKADSNHLAPYIPGIILVALPIFALFKPLEDYGHIRGVYGFIFVDKSWGQIIFILGLISVYLGFYLVYVQQKPNEPKYKNLLNAIPLTLVYLVAAVMIQFTRSIV